MDWKTIDSCGYFVQPLAMLNEHNNAGQHAARD